MLRRLLDDDLVVTRAIRERRYQDLYAVVAAAMGTTQPETYMVSRSRITLFYLKGYRCLAVGKLAALEVGTGSSGSDNGSA